MWCLSLHTHLSFLSVSPGPPVSSSLYCSCKSGYCSSYCSSVSAAVLVRVVVALVHALTETSFCVCVCPWAFLLQVYKKQATASLGALGQRLQEQEEDFAGKAASYQREIQHLQRLLQDKQEALDGVLQQKR